MNSQQRK